jgi:hypothetical protein
MEQRAEHLEQQSVTKFGARNNTPQFFSSYYLQVGPQMKLSKKAKNLILLTTLFILLALIQNSQSDSMEPTQITGPKENWWWHSSEGSFSDPSYSGNLYISLWTQKLSADSNYVENEIDINFILAAPPSFMTGAQNGPYLFKVLNFTLGDGSHYGDVVFSESNQIICYNYEIYTVYDFKTRDCFVNNTANSRFFSNVVLNTMISNESNTFEYTLTHLTYYEEPWSIGSPVAFDLRYLIEPAFALNSTYYTQKNTILETYTITSTPDDSTPEYGWIEQSWDSVVLYHPNYKLRVRDLERNLLYEDTAFQTMNMSTIRRTITINSLKIQNNAPEPINTSFYQSHGYYQGYWSFDNDTVNTQPQNLVFDQSFSYIQREYQNHSKILYLNGTAAITPTATTGSVEFWLNSNASITLFCNNTNTVISSTSNAWSHKFYYFNASTTTINLTGTCYLDALDASFYSEYYVNRNCELNSTEAIYEIIANSNYNHTNHYQALYSFDNDIVNTNCADFTSEVNAQAYIVDSYFNHRKIYKLNQVFSAFSQTYISTGSKTTGDISFWVLLDQSSSTHWTLLRGPTPSFSAACVVAFMSNKIYIYNSTNPVEIQSYSTNTWYHIRISFNCATQIYAVYINNQLINNTYSFYTSVATIDRFAIQNRNLDNKSIYIDALDFSWSSNYFINRNMLENQSTSLESWFAYPSSVSGYYQETDSNWITTNYTDCSASIIAEKDSRKNVLQLSDNSTTVGPSAQILFTSISTGSIEFYLQVNDTTDYKAIYCTFSLDSTFRFRIAIFHNNIFDYDYNALASNVFYENIWTSIRISVNTTHYLVYINNTLVCTDAMTNAGNINKMYVYTQSNRQLTAYLDSVCISSNTNYFISMSSLENTTHSMLAMNYTTAPTYLFNPFLSIQTNPYSYSLSNFTSGFYLYRHLDLYANQIDAGTIFTTENELIYTPPNTREVFISIHDQQSNYLNWEQFQIRINNSLIYENRFYREIGTTWNISIYNQYGLYLTSTLHTVNRDENYVPIQLTKRNLKVYNQQEQFLHVNITYDPNYYSLPYFWSEWLAPKESTEFYLIEDFYRVGISNFENGSAIQYFSYDLQTDDILMISSSNTLYNVLANINNVNTTMNQQFTYVALNFTNTNSAIGNQTILFDINFRNINTTFDDFILSTNTQLDFISSNLTQFIFFQENNFTQTNGLINNLYAMDYNSWIFSNSSLNAIGITSTNTYNYLTNEINDLLVLNQQSLNILNSSIDSSNYWLTQNFTFTNDLINQNQLNLLTEFNFVLNNISNYSSDLSQKILNVNNTINNLTAELSSYIYLVNESIYSAVFESNAALIIQGNNILGNISVTYQQNEYLSKLFQITMFSELLNWSDVAYNYSLIENQIDKFTFLNNMQNESIEFVLRYENEIESISLAATDSIERQMPADNVDYRVKSLTTGQYLTDWIAINGTTIDYGFYTDDLTPDFNTELNDWILTILIFAIICAALTIVIIYQRKQNARKQINRSYANQNRLDRF